MGLKYATWNPSDKHADITLSNGNLTATCSTAWKGVRALYGKNTGKWYWEVTVGTVDCGVSIALSTFDLAGLPGYDTDSTQGYTYNNGGNYNPANGTPPTFVAGDKIMVALDIDSGKLWFGKNGVWNSGDPSLGTNPVFSGITVTAWYPTLCLNGSGSNSTVNFGATAFTYTPPASFQAFVETLCHVSGSITVIDDPVIRAVRAYRRDTGRFLTETNSLSDGTYSLDFSYEGQVYVIALDDSLDTSYNALIADRISPWCPAENRALGKSASASATQSGYPASNAVDGVIASSYWGAGTAAPCSWQVDLGASYDLQYIKILSSPALGDTNYTYVYDVLTSTDGSTWETYDSYNGLSGSWITFTHDKTARYVKVNFTSSSGGYLGWVAMVEVEAWAV